MGYFLMQCETPESRFYKALRIVVRNPGIDFCDGGTVLIDEIL